MRSDDLINFWIPQAYTIPPGNTNAVYFARTTLALTTKIHYVSGGTLIYVAERTPPTITPTLTPVELNFAISTGIAHYISNVYDTDLPGNMGFYLAAGGTTTTITMLRGLSSVDGVRL